MDSTTDEAKYMSTIPWSISGLMRRWFIQASELVRELVLNCLAWTGGEDWGDLQF
jgi:hypothetical protein